jgi:hypothetical protein
VIRSGFPLDRRSSGSRRAVLKLSRGDAGRLVPVR